MNTTITVNIDLKLARKPVSFSTNEELLSWVNACLNCNTNHVEAAATLAAPPTVVVDLSGGLLVAATSTAPVRVVFLDTDTEGGDQERVLKVDGEDVYVSDFVSEVDGQRVQKVIAEVSAQIEYKTPDRIEAMPLACGAPLRTGVLKR